MEIKYKNEKWIAYLEDGTSRVLSNEGVATIPELVEIMQAEDDYKASLKDSS